MQICLAIYCKRAFWSLLEWNCFSSSVMVGLLLWTQWCVLVCGFLPNCSYHTLFAGVGCLQRRIPQYLLCKDYRIRSFCNSVFKIFTLLGKCHQISMLKLLPCNICMYLCVCNCFLTCYIIDLAFMYILLIFYTLTYLHK